MEMISSSCPLGGSTQPEHTSSQPTIQSAASGSSRSTTTRSHFLLTALLGTSFRHLSIQEGRMQLFVETLSGSPLTLSVAADASVASVKQAVEDVEYIQNFRLVCAGKQLTSGSLADYAVGECDTLKMLLSVNGGMRAKWRKKRMRRLRRKRRKMRQRAR
ncbi:hypothetical protein PC129_g7363 [Phytophthora cactorum]|uniref:60S ribosomal protein L41 n=4 Tax=Phytophthora TaxID=4783 RepID=A0A329SJY0_9STRA|nr:hypothetical protein PC113_g13013 [Phytophthora cactorum]KAG2899949.1 hypothetical protein PC114_g13721 [Phytophthora cactorum]KAG2937583.1 hypothetical protein PC117_g11629 [Phytophthora cactorum]KAG3181883.1 hypothetical protein PC128_g14921 [Phytophthora cactorum]KAG3221923.1 hypothetical protein PC129_g7363 [Phytophthora cactorum]